MIHNTTQEIINQEITTQEIRTIEHIECSICYENHSNITTRCNHFFCSDCLTQWINNHNNCPICRLADPTNLLQEIPDEDVITIQEIDSLIDDILNINLMNNLLFNIFEESINNNNVSFYIFEENINNNTLLFNTFEESINNNNLLNYNLNYNLNNLNTNYLNTN